MIGYGIEYNGAKENLNDWNEPNYNTKIFDYLSKHDISSVEFSQFDKLPDNLRADINVFSIYKE